MSKNTLGCTGRVSVHRQDDAAYAVIDDHNGKNSYHLIYDDEREEWIDMPNDDVQFKQLNWGPNDASSGILSLSYFSLVRARTTMPNVGARRLRVTGQAPTHEGKDRGVNLGSWAEGLQPRG